MYECKECDEEFDYELDSGYCDNCGVHCDKCGETKSSDEFDHWVGVCDDCRKEYYCTGCEEIMDNPVEWGSKLCYDCDLKENPHSNYQEIMDSIEDLGKELARRKIFLGTGSCCNGCAAGEAGAEAEKRGWRGYAYYHIQDEDALREGAESLYIGFGTYKDDDKAVSRIRKSLLASLDRIGAWREPDTGHNKHRIQVIVPGDVSGHGLQALARQGE